MLPRSLREDQNADDHEYGEDRGGGKIAYRQSAIGERLIKGIGYCSTEWARQDEGGPEQQGVRCRGEEVQGSGDGQRDRNHERATMVTEPGIRHPVAESCSESLREHDS